MRAEPPQFVRLAIDQSFRECQAIVRHTSSSVLTRALCVLAATMLFTHAVFAQVNLPDFGDSSSTVFSSATEREIGKAFMAEIRQSMTIVDDPEIDDYIQSLGYKLVSETDQQDLRFTFFVIQDDAINAFAAPGGWVGVFSGLLTATENESELASVIAHEVSHVTQRHIARSVELSERSSIATLAGILAAIAIGTQSAEAGSAALAGVLGTRAQSQIDFIRANEFEADRVGIALLDRSGFDPASMAGFFEKLQTASRYYQSPPEFLSTHPVTTTRISEARSRAQQLGVRQHQDSRRYRMVRAKLRVLMSKDVSQLIKSFETEIERNAPRPSPGARYGLALAKQKINDLKSARADLEALGRDYPEEIALRIALARVMVQARDEREGLAILETDWKLRPDNRMIVTTYADALLVANDSRRALKVIDEYARSRDLDAVLLKLKASALQNLNRTAESQFFLAEHYYASGALDLAIHQLTLAAKQPSNDFYNSSRIEARLQRFKEEQAARARKR